MFRIVPGSYHRELVPAFRLTKIWFGLHALGEEGEWWEYCRAFVEKFVEVDTGFAEVALADAVSYSQSLLESLDAARSQLASGAEKGS